jgi:hypothetical protein
MNKVMGAARAFRLDILKDYEVPPANDRNIFAIYRNFILDVDCYTTQIRIHNISRSKKFSVSLSSAEKVKIHHFIVQIKNSIEEANLEEHKKNSLYNKLNDFANEVDKSTGLFSSSHKNRNLVIFEKSRAF